MINKNVILGIGLTASLGILILVAVGHSKFHSVKIPKPRHWDHTPVICATSDVDQEVFEKSVQHWLDHNYMMIIDPTGSACYNAEIIVHGGFVETDSLDGDNTFGITDSLVDPTDQNRIVSVSIMVSGKDELALTHELGHALGFEHPSFSPRGLIMDVGGRIGWSWDGL